MLFNIRWNPQWRIVLRILTLTPINTVCFTATIVTDGISGDGSGVYDSDCDVLIPGDILTRDGVPSDGINETCDDFIDEVFDELRDD